MAKELTARKSGDPTTVKVTSTSEARVASDAARSLAESLGFAPVACDEIALVAQELASNVVRHAGGGELTVGAFDPDGRTGIQIIAEDFDANIAMHSGDQFIDTHFDGL